MDLSLTNDNTLNGFKDSELNHMYSKNSVLFFGSSSREESNTNLYNPERQLKEADDAHSSEETQNTS